MPLAVGRFMLHEIRDAAFSVDGGLMFGPVPRSEWAQRFEPDAENRIRLISRCLLVDAGERCILVDAGFGTKWSARAQEKLRLDRSAFDLERELTRAGFPAERITDVVLSHLHREHAGGTTRRGPGGAVELAFPNATFHVQRRHFRWAHHPTERDAGSFSAEDFIALERSGRLHLCEGELELFEGVQIFLSEGHTVAQQLVRVCGDGIEVLCAGDLVPTAAHLQPAWQMATDLYPLTALEEKKMLLAQAMENGAILFLPHEPAFAGCRVREEKETILAGEPVSF